MLEFLEEKYKIVVIVLLLFLLVSFFNLIGSDRDYNFAEGLFIDLLSPVFNVTNRIKNTVDNTWRVVVDFKEVKQENQELKEKIATLRYNQNNLESVIEQNERLRKLLNFEQANSHQLLGATVIGYNTDNWSNTILINKGRTDGVKQGMPIISGEGYLAGIVQRTSRNNSQTILINDMNFVTSGVVKGSRDLGTIKGKVNFDQVLMDNLEWDAKIEEGDVILTSGLSRNYPKDIPIGKVISVFPDDYGLSQAAYVQPFAQLNKLEEILLITNYNPEVQEDELIESKKLFKEEELE